MSQAGMSLEKSPADPQYNECVDRGEQVRKKMINTRSTTFQHKNNIG